MDPLTIGALVGGGMSAFGSIFGSSQNTAAQEKIAAENIAEQRDFAQHGLSWRVADANSAGINPLAALGFQGPSYSNVVGATNPGAGVAAAGQDIGRAIQSMQDPAVRQAATQRSILDIESKQLDNDIKRTELASSWRKLTQPGTPPGLPNAFTEFKDRTGQSIWLPSEKAAAGFQAMGIPGAVEAVGLRKGTYNATGTFKGDNRTGFTPWDPFGLR